MVRQIVITGIGVFFTGTLIVFAQSENPPSHIPEGMEEIQITGSASLIVPKGAKTRKVGAQIIVEGTKEYMSRRFLEMDARLSAIEKQYAELEKELEALKKTPKPDDGTGQIIDSPSPAATTP